MKVLARASATLAVVSTKDSQIVVTECRVLSESTAEGPNNLMR